MAGPVGVEEFATGFIDPLIGMGSEIIALGLEQIGRELFRTETVIVTKSRSEGRHWDAVD